MLEYIEREAIRKKNIYSYERHERVVPLAEIDWEPAADVVPVIHGHWAKKDDHWLKTYYECSVCNECYGLETSSPVEHGYKYCPNCGAKMDEEA